jgi:hypothetical protein
MANDEGRSEAKGAGFSFGTRELRQAERAGTLVLEQSPPPRQKRDDGGGFDPYNTSGSFDRRKNWSRISKR